MSACTTTQSEVTSATKQLTKTGNAHPEKKRPLDSAQLLKRREEAWEKLKEAADPEDRTKMDEYWENGYCVIRNVFNASVRDMLLEGNGWPACPEEGDKTQRPARRVRLLKDAWFGAKHMIALHREACAPRSKGRFDFQLPPSVVPDVDKVLEETGVTRLIRSICPNAKVRTENIMLAAPGAERQPIHTDSNWKGCAHIDPLPHYLTVLIPLVQQTAEIGGTRVWPGSHRNYKKGIQPTSGYVDMIYPRLKVGDALIFDGLLSHCGMENKSENFDRYFFYMAFSTKHDPNTELTSWT